MGDYALLALLASVVKDAILWMKIHAQSLAIKNQA